MTKQQTDHVSCCFAKATFPTRHTSQLYQAILVMCMTWCHICFAIDSFALCCLGLQPRSCDPFNFPAGKVAGQQRPRQFRSLSKKSVPYFIASSDVLFGLASGMTIKFFPIFFLKQVALPPIGTNFILAGTPLCVAIMSQLASPIAQLLGEHTLLLLVTASRDSCYRVSRVVSCLRQVASAHMHV